MKNINYIETHQYAPELNKIHLNNGVIINAPGYFTKQQIRNNLFNIVSFTKFAVIHVICPKKALNRTYSGTFTTYIELKSFILSRKVVHNLPGTKFKLHISMKGY